MQLARRFAASSEHGSRAAVTAQPAGRPASSPLPLPTPCEPPFARSARCPRRALPRGQPDPRPTLRGLQVSVEAGPSAVAVDHQERERRRAAAARRVGVPGQLPPQPNSRRRLANHSPPTRQPPTAVTPAPLPAGEDPPTGDPPTTTAGDPPTPLATPPQRARAPPPTSSRRPRPAATRLANGAAAAHRAPRSGWRSQSPPERPSLACWTSGARDFHPTRVHAGWSRAGAPRVQVIGAAAAAGEVGDVAHSGGAADARAAADRRLRRLVVRAALVLDAAARVQQQRQLAAGSAAGRRKLRQRCRVCVD